MWKYSIRIIVVIFQTTIQRIVGFYVRHSAIVRVLTFFRMYNTMTGIAVFCPNLWGDSTHIGFRLSYKRPFQSYSAKMEIYLLKFGKKKFIFH